MLEGVLIKLEQSPQIVTIQNKAGENINITVGKFDVLLQVIGTSGRGNSSSSIPAMVYKMHQGNFNSIAERAYQFKTRGLRFSAMSILMDGASGASDERLKAIREESKNSLFGPIVNVIFPDISNKWNVPDLGEGFRSPVMSNSPVLLISGSMDARTPISNGKEVSKTLPNNIHLIAKGYGMPHRLQPSKIRCFLFLGVKICPL
jgi:hypothetical protein